MSKVDSHRFNPEEVMRRKWIQPKPLKPTVNHNTLCEFCSGMVGSRQSECTLMCIYCNVALHRGCLIDIERNFSSDESKISGLLRASNDSWICFHCIESIDDSKMMFEKKLKTAMSYKMMQKSQIIIAKYWRRMHDRSVYTYTYNLILKLQIWIRLLRNRRQYKRRRLEKRRIIKISISHVENLSMFSNKASSTSSKVEKPTSNSIYIIIAVVDQIRGQRAQTWCDFTSTQPYTPHSKLNRNPSAQFNTQYLLPGVSASQIITLSVIQKGAKRDYFLGQVCVNLEVDSLWMTGGTLEEELSQPQYMVKDKSGHDMKFSFSPSSQGHLKFHVHVLRSMTAECGSMVASHIEDLTRFLHKLPATSAFLHHNSVFTEKHPSKPAPVLGSTISSSVAAVSPTQDIKLPLLRAPDAAGLTHSAAKKKLWIAIVEGYLFIYQCYGGPFRLTLSISQFDYSIQPCHQGAVFSLHKFGYPSFHFQTLEKTDFFRWKCALICNIRYLVDPQAEFNTEQFLQDIVKVNAVYMPQPAKTPHFLRRGNTSLTLNHSHFKSALRMSDVVGGDGDSGGLGRPAVKRRSKVNAVRPENSNSPLLSIEMSSSSITTENSSALSFSGNLPAGTFSSIDDSVVDLRHSLKLKHNKKSNDNNNNSGGDPAQKKRSNMLSSMLAVASMNGQFSVPIGRSIGTSGAGADAAAGRSFSALEIQDKKAATSGFKAQSRF